MSAFTDLLVDFEAPKRFLLVLEPYDLGTSLATTLYYSSHGFTSSPIDDPANTYYDARIKQGPTYQRSLYQQGKLSGRSIPSVGSITLVNDDGELDNLSTAYAWGGRRARLYLGSDDFSLSQYGLVLDATVQALTYSDDELIIEIRDYAANLDNEIQPLTFAGTGGNEGGPDLYGKRKPYPIGIVRNVSPVYLGVNSGKHVFSVGPDIVGIIALYDRGVPLTPASGAATAGQYNIDLSGGTITLGGSFVGPITVDMIGKRYLSVSSTVSVSLAGIPTTILASGSYAFPVVNSAGFYINQRVRVRSNNDPTLWMDGVISSISVSSISVSPFAYLNNSGLAFESSWTIMPWGTVAGLIRAIASDAGVQSFTDSSFSDLETAQYRSVGIWIPEGGNVLQILDTISDGVGSYWGFDRFGSLGVGRVDVPSSPIASLDRTQINSCRRMPTDDPRYVIVVRYQHNFTPMDNKDIASATTNARRVFNTTEWRQIYLSSYDELLLEDGTSLLLTEDGDPIGIEPAYPYTAPLEMDSVFGEDVDTSTGIGGNANTIGYGNAAADEADRLVGLFGVPREYYQVTYSGSLMVVDVGDTVHITYDRFGLESGKDFLVIDLAENLHTGDIQIGVWG